MEDIDGVCSSDPPWGLLMVVLGVYSTFVAVVVRSLQGRGAQHPCGVLVCTCV